jgi:hypothetical protein
VTSRISVVPNVGERGTQGHLGGMGRIAAMCAA